MPRASQRGRGGYKILLWQGRYRSCGKRGESQAKNRKEHASKVGTARTVQQAVMRSMPLHPSWLYRWTRAARHVLMWRTRNDTDSCPNRSRRIIATSHSGKVEQSLAIRPGLHDSCSATHHARFLRTHRFAAALAYIAQSRFRFCSRARMRSDVDRYRASSRPK